MWQFRTSKVKTLNFNISCLLIFNSRICLAIVNPDSTCVFYQLSNSLDPPTAVSQKSTDQTQKLDKDLKKHKQLLQEAAMYGIPITLPRTNPQNEAGTSGT